MSNDKAPDMGAARKIKANSGHGHVWARPDGLKMRCGGPAMCKECKNDYFAFHQKTYFKETAAQQASTAIVQAAPSQEDVVQGGIAVSAAPTPETDAILKLMRELNCAHGEKYFALKGAIECGIENLERERDEAMAARDFFQNIAKSNLSDAEKAESELAAVREQLNSVRKTKSKALSDVENSEFTIERLRKQLAAANKRTEKAEQKAQLLLGVMKCVMDIPKMPDSQLEELKNRCLEALKNG